MTEPTKEDLEAKDFNAVWNVIKSWDLERSKDDGYAGANGTDVMAILDAVRPVYMRIADLEELLAKAEKERDEHRKKWWHQEQEYILPCFDVAKKNGIDLKALVSEAKGNCTIRLLEAFEKQKADLEAENKRLEVENKKIRDQCNPWDPEDPNHGLTG